MSSSVLALPSDHSRTIAVTLIQTTWDDPPIRSAQLKRQTGLFLFHRIVEQTDEGVAYGLPIGCQLAPALPTVRFVLGCSPEEYRR